MKALLKGLGVAVLLSVTGVAWAGETAQASGSSTAIYAEIGGGGYYRNLRQDSVIGAQNQISSWSRGRMGWQAGVDAGYRFWKNIAGEMGFFWMQNQKMTFDSAKSYSGTAFAKGADIDFKSWAIYLAGRASYDILVDWSVYAKLGVAYIRTDVDYRPVSSGEQTGNGSLWSPLLGVGATYQISKHWFAGLDYAIFIGNSITKDPFYSSRLTGSGVHVPTLQRFTLNLGYLLEI